MQTAGKIHLIQKQHENLRERLVLANNQLDAIKGLINNFSNYFSVCETRAA